MVTLHRVNEQLSWFDLLACDTPQFISPYLLLDEQVAVVETGPACGHDRLLAALVSAGVRPSEVDWILPTHIHLDHAGGAGHLAKVCSNARVLLHPLGLPHMLEPTRLWHGSVKVLGGVARAYGPPLALAAERTVEAREGQLIELGATILQVHFTPGHASHHLSYFEPQRKWLFAGDAAGLYYEAVGGAVPVTPPPFRHDQQLETLERLLDLGPRTICYTHFGPRQPGGALLEDLRREYTGWMGLCQAGHRYGWTPDQVWDRVRLKFVKAAGCEIENQTRFPQRGTNLRSIEGMLRYLDWELVRKS